MRGFVLGVLVLAGAGCSTESHELFVDVRTDLVAVEDFDLVVTEVFADESRPAIRQHDQRLPWPRGVGLPSVLRDRR